MNNVIDNQQDSNNDFNETNDINKFKILRNKNINNPIFAYYNINSLRNKIHDIREIISRSLPDILVLAETKIDGSFPTSQFLINNYNEPTRSDRSEHGGGVIEYVRCGIIRKRLRDFELKNFESVCSEISIKNTKWFLLSAYRSPNSGNISNFFFEMNQTLNKSMSRYDNVVIMGDLNIDLDDKKVPGFEDLKNFMALFDLTNIVKEKTCKTRDHESLIDVILTNKSNYFMYTKTLELGVSDFHKMSITILKSQVARLKPKIIKYRSYKNFNEDKFLKELDDNFKKNFSYCYDNYENSDEIYNNFVNILSKTIEKHAPLKSKKIRGNQASFMGKELSKAIMKRSMFKTNYQKHPTPENREKYNKQRNKCVSIRRNAIRNYFNLVRINGGSMSNKEFYDIFKPYLTNKGALVTNDITIAKDGKLITESFEIAEIFNKYYANIFENATGKKPTNIKKQLPVDVTKKYVFNNIVEAYINHPSIIAIKENFPCQDVFSFREVSEKEIFDNLNNLNTKKSTGDDDISSKFLKLSARYLNTPLAFTINASIIFLNFPTKAKRAVVTAIYKSDDKTNVKNYRPVSILNSISKIFEKVIKNQIVPFFDNCWSKYISAYRKSHSCQHVLIRMIENLRKNLDQSKLVGVILMDLSKAFDCIPHDLLIEKLNTYGLSENAILYIYSYLKERQQCVKINNTRSLYELILSGVPQGSILEPILFNIFINDLFVFIKTVNIHNYADDNSLEAAANTLEELIAILEGKSNIAIDWLEGNEMIPNAKKFQALIVAKNKVGIFNKIPITIKGKTIFSKSSVKFLGINIDNKLNFDEHIRSLCNKGGQQLNALFRLNRYLTFESKKILVNSFIYSNFNYCPLVWHFT